MRDLRPKTDTPKPLQMGHCALSILLLWAFMYAKDQTIHMGHFGLTKNQ